MTAHHLLTYALGLAGAVVFIALNLPLPWLFGPMAFCLLGALAGLQIKTVKPLGEAMRTILGVAVGASVSVGLLLGLGDIWATLLLVPVMVLLIGWIGVWFFQRFAGYDFPTAYYAAMPGGLQDMIVFGEEAGGNVRAISLIHATRVLVIVVLLPLILVSAWGADLDRPPGAAIASFDPVQLAIMAGCGLIGWQGAKRLGLFGASILGPLILAALASLVGILNTRPPAEVIWAAQYFIAVGIGSKYTGVTAKELRHDITAGLGFCLILLGLTAVMVEGVVLLDLAAPIDAILSLAPGGQAELVVLALIVGADIGFIVAHHLLRIFIVILGAPILARLFDRGPGG